MAQVDVSLLVPGASGDGWSVDSNGYLKINQGAQIEFINGAVEFLTQNYGTILGGTFNSVVNNINNATISSGTFYNIVNNINNSTISSGIFNDKVSNNNATISGGTFNGSVVNDALPE